MSLASRVMTAAVVVLVVVTALVWVLTRPEVGLGEQVDAERPHWPGRSVRFETPAGWVEVRVGAVTDDPDEGYRDLPDPGVGRGYLPVAVHHASGETGVALEVDGEEHPIVEADSETDEADESNNEPVARYLVVERDAVDDLRVLVEYDGATQRGDPATGEIDAGVAAGLYEPAGGVGSDCRHRVSRYRDRAVENLHCRTHDLELTPYDPDLGWVESADERWAVMSEMSVEVPYLELPGGGYEVLEAAGAERVTLGGQRPALRREKEENAPAQLVFEAPGLPAKLEWRRPYRFDDERVVVRAVTRYQEAAR